MPSTYTLNNGIELIATGEQSGTWGDTTNTNFELLDTALDGQVSVTLAATGSSGSPNTLPISDGASSNGRNRLVIFGDGGDLGGTAFVQLTPNDAEKIIYVRNNLAGSRSILLFQGTYSASNDYEVPAGTTAVVFFNGAGSGAVAANVFNNAHFDALNVVGQAKITTGSGNTYPTASTSADELVVSNLTASEPSGITIFSDNASSGNIFFGDENDADNGRIVYEHASGTGNPSMQLATNGAERLRIDSSGRVLIGTTSSQDIGSKEANLQIRGLSGQDAAITIVRNDSGVVGGSFFVLGKSRGDAEGDATIVSDGDTLGTIRWAGADGTDVASLGAEILGEVDGTPGANDMPGRLVFATTSDGASSSTERMRITNAGNVEIGFARSDVNGKLNVSGNVGVRNFLATSNPTGGAFSFTDPNSSTILGILRVGDDDGSTSSVADLQIISYGSADDDGGGNIRFINSRYSKETGLIKSSRQSTNTGYMDFYTENGSGLQRALRIDSSQRVLIGTTTARSTAGHTANLQVEGSGSFSEATVSIVGNENNSNGAYLNFGKSRGTTAGSNTIVQDGDVSGQIQFTAADGTDMVSRVAAITAKVDGTPGANDTPGLLDFSTTADGASDPTLRMRIDNAGKVLIGTTTQNFSRLNFGQDEYIGFHSGNSSAGGLRFEDNSGYASAEIRFQGTGSNQAAAVVFSTGDSPGSENITEAMRIDSSQRVLIGLTSDIGTGHKLQLNSDMTIMTFDGTTTGANGVRYIKSRATSPGSNAIVANGDDVGFLDFRADDGTDYATRTAVISSGVDGTPGTNDMPGNIRFWTTADGASAVTERMRINNSGNVAIATTSFNMYQDGSNNYGANIYNTGQAAFSVNDSITVYSNRQNGDGTHITFRRDGAEKGVIGLIATDNLYIGSTAGGHTGISFGSNEWTPMSPAGTNADDLVDIGAASRRIRKIFTSQGIFLGGTGSSNQLEDYEEGTFTPVIQNITGSVPLQSGVDTLTYTKIGRVVYIQGRIRFGTITSASGSVQIGNLPFTSGAGTDDSEYAYITIVTYGVDLPTAAIQTFGEVPSSANFMPFLYQTDNAPWTYINATSFSTNDYLGITGFYYTDS